MTLAANTAPNPWQKKFASALTELSRNPDLPIRLNERRSLVNNLLPLVVSVDTTSIPHVEGGLRLNNREQFIIVVPESSTKPPDVLVMDDRFVGFPHVMHGKQLCIYLDPSREWNPVDLALGFVDRLWGWLTDAAAARFAAGDALYHAIGGVPSGATADTILVVRDDIAAFPVRLHGVRRLAALIPST